MNPSFKRAKKRPSWNIEREKDRETREWKVVVGTVVGYCSRPNRKGEVKKEQRQRTKGGKECQKKKNGNARVGVLLPADLSYWPSVAQGEGLEAHVERWNRGSRRSNRNGKNDTRLPTVDTIDWFFSRRNDFGSETRSDDRWNDFEPVRSDSWMYYSALIETENHFLVLGLVYGVQG